MFKIISIKVTCCRTRATLLVYRNDKITHPTIESAD